jgi:hypothetical protein
MSARTNAEKKRARKRPSSRRRASKPPTRDDALPPRAYPTSREIEELGRFADRVADGIEPLTYVKL